MKADSLHCGSALKIDLQKCLWYIFFQRFLHLSLYKAKIPLFQTALQAWPGHSSGQLPLPYSYLESSLAVSQASPKTLLGHRCVQEMVFLAGEDTLFCCPILTGAYLYCGSREQEMFLIQTLWLEFIQGEDLSITGILPAQEKTCTCDIKCISSEPAGLRLWPFFFAILKFINIPSSLSCVSRPVPTALRAFLEQYLEETRCPIF